MAIFTEDTQANFSRKNKKNLIVMIKGYMEMGRINMSLAEEGLYSDNQALKGYEHLLSESEQCDSEKRRHILR